MSDYKENYKIYQLAMQKGVKPADEWKLLEGKLDGTTTYKEGYVPKGSELKLWAKDPAGSQLALFPVLQNPSFKPDNKAFSSGAKFEGNSTYTGDYIGKSLQACPAELVQAGR